MHVVDPACSLSTSSPSQLTVDSDAGEMKLNELCCRRTIYRWNPQTESFRLMYGLQGKDEK